MLIAQLSDPHIRAGRALAFNAADSALALERTAAHLHSLRPRPDCVVISGDVAEHGEKEAYKLAAEILAGLPAPFYVLPGNHDHRENMRQTFRQACPADETVAPLLCYTLDKGPLRLIMLDSTAPQAHAGVLSPKAAAWLERSLGERPQAPTLIFTHHPPFLSALGRMDEPYSGAEHFAAILGRNPQARLCCGHLHRALLTIWGGVAALCCPPLVMPIVPELTPTGGDCFTLESPGYLLHHFFDGRINSHFCRVPGAFPYAGPYSFSSPPNPTVRSGPAGPTGRSGPSS